MSSKVVKSIFLVLISAISFSLCVTLAWFSAIRINQVNNGFFKAVKMDGTLYYYCLNYKARKDQTGNSQEITYEVSGFDDDTIISFRKDKFISDSAPTTNADYQFYNVNADLNSINSFNMSNALPGSRFLFLIKAKHNFNNANLTGSDAIDKSTAKLIMNKWEAKWEEANLEKVCKYQEGGVEKTKPISFKEAVKMYTLGAFKVDDPNLYPNLTQAYNNLIPCDGFNNNDDPSGTNIVLSTYELEPLVEYYIPFVIEFSDNPSTYYVFKGFDKRMDNGNEITIEYYSKKSNENEKVDSNVYENASITAFSLTLELISQ